MQTHTFGSHIVAAMPSRETTAIATRIFRRVKPCVGVRRIACRGCEITDPVGPLQDNGGPTMTHALQTVPVVSVAIDKIPEADCVHADGSPLTTDQRGQPRPETGGTMCDVGAFEVQP